jgi:hypothetical protein
LGSGGPAPDLEECEVKSVLASLVLLWAAASPAAAEDGRLSVRVSWGHRAEAAVDYHVAVAGAAGVDVRSVTSHLFEADDRLQNGVAQTRAGKGDADGLDVSIAYPLDPAPTAQNVHILWTDLIAASDAGTARRLLRDPAFKTRAPALTIRLDAAATRGFTVAVDQLVAEKALWVPSYDVYVTAGDAPVALADHLRALASRKEQRILDRLRIEPEATYAEYTAKWEDMGNPSYSNPQTRGPGHIVGLTWDSAIRKFGIDRGAGVWPDDGNPDKVRFWFAFGELGKGVGRTWKGQRLANGLPVITTTFEDAGIRYEVEQFAYPLHGPPPERRGDMPMVLLQQLTITELNGTARTLPVSMTHRRQFPPYADGAIEVEREGNAVLFKERGRRGVLLAIEGTSGETPWSGTHDYQGGQQKRIDTTVFVDLPARGSRQFVVKLPSPIVDAGDVGTLIAVDYDKARAATLAFWSEYIERGAQFRVPEQAVNDLFRANLWHALRLPRRHGGATPAVAIDLPYSNFAYSQTGTPWPINQAVYVDYMLYGLRGYPAIATEELGVQFRNNQEADGHVGGYANWLVYTPGMLYAVAQNYLLSNDRAGFERLLPQGLAAMDWCLGQIARASSAEGPARGLVRGPLNDLSGQGIWAFNQAYLFAGLDLFGRALERHGHPRAHDARRAAGVIRESIARGFGAASMRSPLVQLRDGTWMPYVPAEALTPRRLLDQWYATDVDTGAVHLLRLQALPARGVLADALLNDHEDNLFYKGWGIANEPVYNQHATAYLLRDEPEAAVRAFYSYMASGFSHSVFEPVEHRWTHGQYFGPPSTDGAWFELYRNMLVHERDDDALLLAQATPRAWLRNGQKIELERVPTYYGEISATFESRAASGEIRADIRMPGRARPSTVMVRFRHPDGKRMRAVTVNGRASTDFAAAADWVRLPSPAEDRYVIVVQY